MQRLQLVADLGDVLEMIERLLNVHFQHVGDRLLFVLDLQRFAVEAMSLADRAGDPDIGQEVHLELVRPVAVASFAPPAVDVETESARLVAAAFRLAHLGEEAADLVQQLDVGGRIAARRATDGRLVDGDHLVEVLQPFDRFMHARLAQPEVQIATQGLDQDVANQRTLARAGNAGHTNERPQGDLDVDLLEIVLLRAADDQLLTIALAALLGNFDLSLPG